MDVVPVTADRLGLVEELFATSRVMTGCWCMWPRLERGAFRPGDPDNRERMTREIETGTVPGLLALDDGAPVGWCAVGYRHVYPQYGEVERDERVWAVPCIFVAEAGRSSGVAQALVQAAVGHCARAGAVVVHGPPAWWLAGGPDAAAAAVAAFVRNGFEQSGAGARMPLLVKRIDA
jgi:GNAT superfamily N-acetyltransferase